MRIHTDHHTADTIRTALAEVQGASLVHPDVLLAVLREHRSTKRERAFEVQLGAPAGTPSFLAGDAREYLRQAFWEESETARMDAVKCASKRYNRNGYGTAPADSPLTATWHEWGYFLAALFAADSRVIAGPYADIYDFIDATNGSYLSPGGYDYMMSRGRVADFLTALCTPTCSWPCSRLTA